MPTVKQSIYEEMLFFALAGFRNRELRPLWKRLTNTYAETELVHNLPPLLVEPEFTVHDVYWLNCQAYNFSLDGRRTLNYRGHMERISRLFAIVPEELKVLLKWHGPEGIC